MTSPAPPLEWENDADLPRKAHWREYGAALLPLALWGALPWWATLLLCLLFAQSVRSSRWHEARLLVGLLIVALALLPDLNKLVGVTRAEAGPLLVTLGTRYLGWLFGLGLVYWSTIFLEGGQRRGLLTLLGAGLMAPQPLLLLALAGGAILRPGVDVRLHRARPQSWQERQGKQRVWGLLGAAILAALLLATLLPRQAAQVLSGVPPQTRQLPDQSANKPPLPLPKGSMPPTTVRPSDRAVMEEIGLSPPPYELLNAMLLLNVLAIFIFLTWNGRTWGLRRKLSLLDILMVAGLVLTLLIGLTLSLGGSGEQGTLPPQSGGQAGQAVNVAPISAEDIQRVKRNNILSWVFFLLQFGVMAAAMWLLWKYRPRLEKALTLPTAEEDQILEQSDRVPPALHRVRLAYLQAETALTEAGYGRMAAETPLGYAARLAGIHPPLTTPLGQLTRIYSPVRYGGQVSDDHAAEAEAAAAEIGQLAATLPRLDADDLKS